MLFLDAQLSSLGCQSNGWSDGCVLVDPQADAVADSEIWLKVFVSLPSQMVQLLT